MIQQIINQLVDGKDLTEETAQEVMQKIMSGQVTDAQIVAFLIALRLKGETTEEIIGCANAMRDKANKICPVAENLVDTCGTGGDQPGTFNISTVSALVTAGASVPVAKHGNKAVSSKCGSADILEALGVNIKLEPKQVEECINKVGIGFMFAPNFHPAMKHVAPVRKEMGIRTIFNILGPLTNPASAKFQVMGVFKPRLTEPLAKVLGGLGSGHVLVVHGLDGLDEISITDETQVSELLNGQVKTYKIKPEDFDMPRADLKDISADSIEENLQLAMSVLRGQTGPARDVVLLNAGAAIYVSGKVDTMQEGAQLARESIDSGKARKKLEELREFTNQNQ